MWILPAQGSILHSHMLHSFTSLLFSISHVCAIYVGWKEEREKIISHTHSFIQLTWASPEWCATYMLLLFSCQVVSNSLWPRGLQTARFLCPPLSPGVCSNLSFELVMLSSHLILCHPLLLLPQIFPSLRVFSSESASSNHSVIVLELQLQHPMNIQGWFPLELTALISLQSKGLSRVFSST